MSTILAFPLDRCRRHHKSAGQSVAEVVIFPGIRIERKKFNLADRLDKSSQSREFTGIVQAD